MDTLTFCREAKDFARRLIHGWYEKTASLPELLQNTEGAHFSLIGPNGADYVPEGDETALRARLHAMQDLPAPLCFGKETYTFHRLTPTACLIIARYQLHTDLASGVLLGEEQRASLLLCLTGDSLRLAHLHVSNPASRRNGSLYFHRMSDSTAVYAAEILMKQRMRPIPGLTHRQQLVLALLMQGRRYDDIAALLQVTPRTVRYYVTELCTRLHVANRSQLIAAGEAWRKETGTPTDIGGGAIIYISYPFPCQRPERAPFCLPL